MVSDLLIAASLAIPFGLVIFARMRLAWVGVLGLTAGLGIWAIGVSMGAFETEEGSGEELALAYGVPLYVLSWLAVTLAAYGVRLLLDRRARAG